MGKIIKNATLFAAVACCLAQSVMTRPAYSVPVAAISEQDATKHADVLIAQMMVEEMVGGAPHTINFRTARPSY